MTTPAETLAVPSPVRPPCGPEPALATSGSRDQSWPSGGGPPLVTLAPVPSNGNGASAEYTRWAQHNLMPQRQPGYAVVWVKLLAGTVLSGQFRGLADLLDRHHLSAVRIAISQDLVIPWVPAHRSKEIFNELKSLDLATPGALTIADVTGCPGATTCNLGITRSLTLAEELATELAGESDPEVKKVRVKISGCPNSCGQHHIADIGFYGNARKIGERQAPYYQLMLGGEVSDKGVRFARQVLPLPGKRIPQALRELLKFYKQDRQLGESFRSWAQRTPDESIVNRLQPYADTAGEVEDLFTDWGDRETYSLKLGRGECAA